MQLQFEITRPKKMVPFLSFRSRDNPFFSFRSRGNLLFLRFAICKYSLLRCSALVRRWDEYALVQEVHYLFLQGLFPSPRRDGYFMALLFTQL